MTPQRLLILVGLPLGVLISFLSPAWTAYDEFTHFARVVDMANGQLEPAITPSGTGSFIPAAHREATSQIIIDHGEGRPPWSMISVRALMDHSPDGRMIFVDTRPTTASTPVGYLPATLGAVIPVAVDAPGVIVLWAGRLASLGAYLALSYWAVRTARAFRWSLAAAALIPLNLALASSVSPDGLTIAAVLIAVATWSRVEAGENLNWGALLTSTFLLALAKPPYFLVLALFPLSWILNRSQGRRRAALAAAGALTVGLATSLARSSENYRATTTTLIQEINYQPAVQRDRLIGDLPGFLWATVDTWITEFRHYIQGWYRQLGFWEADLPGAVPWILSAVTLVALATLDGQDLRRLRGVRRVLMGGGVALLVVAIYAAAYIYFTDRIDYAHIGMQMARYSGPLAVLAILAWTPRALGLISGRLDNRLAAGLLGIAPAIAVCASVATWLWTGAGTPL